MVFNGQTEPLEQLNHFVEETVVLTLNPERPFEARKEKPVCFSENLKSAGFLLLLLLAFKVRGSEVGHRLQSWILHSVLGGGRWPKPRMLLEHWVPRQTHTWDVSYAENLGLKKIRPPDSWSSCPATHQLCDLGQMN